MNCEQERQLSPRITVRTSGDHSPGAREQPRAADVRTKPVLQHLFVVVSPWRRSHSTAHSPKLTQNRYETKTDPRKAILPANPRDRFYDHQSHYPKSTLHRSHFNTQRKASRSTSPEVRAIRTENALPHIVEATTEQSQQEYDDSNLALSQ